MTRWAEFPKDQAEQFIRKQTGLTGPLRWELLHGDGSERTFYRVSGQKENLVLVWSPLDNETFPNENDSYVYIGRHLHKKGIPVPIIFGYSRSEGLTLLEDLGPVHLQDAVRSAGERLTSFYNQAVDLLLRIQVHATEDLDTSQCFDTPVYDPQFIIRRELEYFRWSFLEGALGLKIDSDYLKSDFSLLASRAGEGAGQLFLIHRDFQSRNLMVKDDLLYVIDFQGARLGPPQYDLASLLLDPYVQLPQSLQNELLRSHSSDFCRLAGISVDEFLDRFSHVALCRNLQILAAFSFLTRVKGRSHFAQYISPAWMGLRRLLEEAPCLEYRLLTDLVQRQSDEEVAKAAARLEKEAQQAAGSEQQADQ